MKQLLSLAITAIAIQPVYADKLKPEEMLVTASRIQQPLFKSLASSTVIDQSDIIRSQSIDLPDLLTRIPGISIDQNGGLGANTAIRMRGSESDQVLILIDGVRTASASNGATALQHIPVEQIERIEIVRGPRSSLYGAEAVGGVIQIFTKRGKNAEKPLTPSLRVEYGSHNTKIGNAGFTGKVESTNYSLQIGHKDSDGINRTVGSTGADTDTDGYREFNISAGIDHQIDNQTAIGLSYLMSDGVTQFDSGAANDRTDFKNENISVYVTKRFGEDIDVKLEIGTYKDERETFSSFPSVFDTNRESALLQVNYKLADKQTLTAGYDYYIDEVEGTSGFTEDERDNKAFFIQYAAEFDTVTFQTSLREDDNEAFGNSTTGNLAVGVEFLEDTFASISYGTAFKAPTFNDLYFPFTDFIFFTFEGNPSLDPEESETVELLVRHVSDSYDWSVAVYQTDIEDLIDRTATSLENIDEAEILGAEATFSTKIAGWQTELAIEYIDAVDGTTNDRLENRPRGKASANFSRSFGKFYLTISWLTQADRITSGNQLSGYNVTDVKGSYPINDDLTIGFNVKNIFDNDYTLIDGFRTYKTEGQTAAVFARYSL